MLIQNLSAKCLHFFFFNFDHLQCPLLKYRSSLFPVHLTWNKNFPQLLPKCFWSLNLTTCHHSPRPCTSLYAFYTRAVIRNKYCKPYENYENMISRRRGWTGSPRVFKTALVCVPPERHSALTNKMQWRWAKMFSAMNAHLKPASRLWKLIFMYRKMNSMDSSLECGK